MSVVDASFDYSHPLEEHATMPLAGGIAGMGFQCGQLWGAALAAGAQAYRQYGPGPQAEAAAVAASQKLAEIFRARYKSINCSDVTQIEWKSMNSRKLLGFFLKGGPVRCFTMTADYARAAYNEIDMSFSGSLPAPVPAEAILPVSCASMLARRLGASDMQVTMAAGFAGGIGLSGGACGALAAAIWIQAINSPSGGTLDFNSPAITGTVDRFVENTEIEFECCQIVGRRFKDDQDHSAYLQSGGCAQVLDALCADSDNIFRPAENQTALPGSSA
jgi:hypothetical protein